MCKELHHKKGIEVLRKTGIAGSPAITTREGEEKERLFMVPIAELRSTPELHLRLMLLHSFFPVILEVHLRCKFVLF